MKLRVAPPSPFARTTVVTAHETSLIDQIELVLTDPWAHGTDLVDDNPIGKIPTLILNDGTVIGESWAVCEYLDAISGRNLTPADADLAFELRLRALGNGLLDAAVARRIETFVRPEDYRWDGWVERQKDKINRILDAVETFADDLNAPLTLGQISLACGLAYLDFRFAEDTWAAPRPGLANWYDAISQRPSMLASQP